MLALTIIPPAIVNGKSFDSSNYNILIIFLWIYTVTNKLFVELNFIFDRKKLKIFFLFILF